MAFDLVYRDQPDQQLSKLEGDPRREGDLAHVEDILAGLAADPGDRRLRTTEWVTRVRNEVVHMTTVPALDWRIVWQVRSSTELEIIYLGPPTGES